MQLTKHIGCLLALVITTASALAETGTEANGSQWFTAEIGDTLSSPWTVGPGGTWTWNANYGSFKGQLDDPATELVYSAPQKTDMDETVNTTVKFTAMDIADALVLEVPDNAKAGLTLVEDENGALAYWGLVNTGSELKWKPLTTDSTLTDESPVPVKVALFKVDGDVYANYTIDGGVLKYNDLADIPLSCKDPKIISIAYRGMCDLWSLSGLAWSNDPKVPDKITIDGGKEIAYNHQELKAFGVNLDDDASIKTFFEKISTKNGLKGWVNYAIGNVEEREVGVVSNKCEKGTVALDFGIAVAEGHTVEYVIDSNAGTSEAEIALKKDTNNTKIHTVAVKVDGEVIKTETVGVMEATNPYTKDKTRGYDIVAVPWDAFAGQTLTVATLLNTAVLTENDVLYVDPNGTGSSYSTYKLVGGVWTTPYGANQKSAEEQDVAQGSAIWLEHGPDSRIIFVGAVASEVTVKPTVQAPAGKWTLVANPSIKKLNLNGDGVFNPAQVGDQIVIEDANDPRQYEYVGENDADGRDPGWGYYMSKVTEVEIFKGGPTVPCCTLEWNTTDCYVPAGIGFWYVNNGKGEVTITFPDNQEEAPAAQ